jgi:hypothetical protein
MYSCISEYNPSLANCIQYKTTLMIMRTQLFMANLLLLAGNTSAQTSFVHCSLDSVVLANLRQKLVCEDSSYNRKHIPF